MIAGPLYRRLFRELFCQHKWEWLRNIYGDEIIHRGYHRSVWTCSKCGAWTTRKELYREGGPNPFDSGDAIQ
jgi:hypothetical protein